MKKITQFSFFFILFLSLFQVDAQSFTQFRGLGADDSAGSGFKTISTNSVLVVSNNATGTTGPTVGSELFSKLTTAGGTDVITLKADGINAVSFDVNDLSIFNYLIPASNADYTTNTKIVFKNSVGTVIRTMTLNATKSLTSSMSGVSISTFFDNNASLPVTGVSEIEITINPSTVSVDAFTIENISLSNIVSGAVTSGPEILDFNTLGISNTISNTLGKSTAIGPLNFEINSPNASDLITFKANEGAGGTGALYDNNVDIGGITKWTISRHDDSEFTLSSIYLQEAGVGASTSGTLKARRNGSQVGSTVNVTFNGDIDVSGNPDFTNIDEVWIEAADINFYLDNVAYIIPSTVEMPTITTTAANSITATGVTFNGEVTSDGGATVSRGFVYSIIDNTPAIGEIGVTQVTVGSGIGVFSKAISGLNPSTTYYYRAYATNSAGTTYGGVQSFTTSNPQLVNFSWSADNLSAEATGVTYTFSYEIVTANPYNILYAINNYGWELPFMGLSENNYEITPIEKENVTVKVNGSDRDFNVRNWSSGLLIVRLTDPTVASGSHVEIIIENVTNKSVGTHNWTWIRTSTSGGQEIDGVVSPNSIVLSANTPTVSTAAATSITTNGATVAGNVTSDGGATVFARGFVYSSTDNTPTIGETGVTQVTDGSGTGVFDEGISGLSSSTTYYYRAYATNSAGTTYGGIENFTTLVANTPPLVDANMGLMVSQGTTGNIDSGKLHFNDDETEDDDQLTGTIISAVAHGILFLDVNLNNIFDLGDEELIVNATFTQDNVNNDRLRYTNTIANETSDSFVFKVSDSDGGELSNQTFNITINQIPTVTVNNGLTLDEGTTELIDSGRLNATDAESGGGSDITFTITSAVSHGILFIDSNPSNVFEAGDIELIENATFTLDDINNDKLRYTNTVGNQTTDSFEFKVSDPDGGELTNQTFTITINLLEAPTVTTTAATDVTNTTATLGGEVTNSGSATATEYGIVYNTTGAPTIADTKVQIGSGIGSFAQEITALTAATTYYVRAYAINAVGTSYGSEESFITSTLGLDDSLKNAISLYPNPVNNLLFITNDTKIENIILFDVMGKRIGTLKMDNNVINVSNLETGIYILKIETSNGNVIERIIKR